MKSTHWAHLSEAGSSTGLWLLYWVHRLFGRLPFRLVVYPVIIYFYLTRSVARHASLQYLQYLQESTGALGTMPNWRTGVQHFLQFAETMLDKLLAMSGRYDFSTIQVAGAEAVRAQLAKGRGVLLMTAHLGNLELCQACSEELAQVKLLVLVHTPHAERFNRMLEKLNPDLNIQLRQVTQIDPVTIMELSERIEQGYVVVIAADRVPVVPASLSSQNNQSERTPRVAQADFLGHSAAFPVGPYVLAGLLQCPSFLMFCTQSQSLDKSYKVVFELFQEHVRLPRVDREKVFAELAQRYANRLAAQCVKAPLEWFNFYPFWDKS